MSKNSLEQGGVELGHRETRTISGRLDDLETSGKDGFCFAWERIGDVLIKDIQLGNKLTPEVQAVYDNHKDSMGLWNELNQRVYDNNMDSSVITDDEFRRAIDGYKELVRDLDLAMGEPDRAEDTAEVSEKSSLEAGILARAEGASEKVKQRVEERFIPNVSDYGAGAQRWLQGLQNDFYHLVENPDDESGGGNYEGWSPDEIRELYSVLYGEAME